MKEIKCLVLLSQFGVLEQICSKRMPRLRGRCRECRSKEPRRKKGKNQNQHKWLSFFFLPKRYE